MPTGAAMIDPQPPPTDHELVARASDGDALAFHAIMRRHNQLLFCTARGILRDDAEAEDALQEAWLRAWRALRSFREDARLSTWLVRIVINESLGRVRRRHAPAVPWDAAADEATEEAAMTEEPERQPEQAAMREEMRRLMEDCIDRLPDAYRSVFMLYAVEEMSVRDIATALEISQANVRTRFLRARRLLRSDLSSRVDLAIGDAFAFAGARCDRVVAAVMARLAQERQAPPET